MTVEVLCPHCGAAYQIAPEKMGKSARCKKCSQNFSLESRAGQTSHSQAALETGRGGDSSTNKQPARKLGRFEIRAKLGSGAFGTVYRAFDPLLEREVALKVPHPAALETEADKARYLREPKAAAQLRHPNIVPIFDAGVDNGQYYIASAFIDGKTLQSRLEEQRPDLRETAQLVMKLASALQYAHEQGIVHRDVKPANIMLDMKGEPHLMDFGLAQIRAAEDRLTHDGTVLGTPAYMSPEQARGQASEVGPPSDQYSLGVVLYELLCGERPFSGPPALVISLVQTQEPDSPRKHNSAIPRDLETICLKAMSKESGRRYENCSALQDDLRNWLSGLAVRARPLSAPERAVRWCRRNPVISALAALVILVLAFGFTVSSLFAVVAIRKSKIAADNARIAQQRALEIERKQKEVEDNRKKAEDSKARADKSDAAAKSSQTSAAASADEAEKSKEREREQKEAREAAEAESKRNAELADESERKKNEAAEKERLERERADREREEKRRVQYATQMKQAHDAWATDRLQVMRDILDKYPSPKGSEDVRGFEWHYLKRIAREEITLRSHSAPVKAVAFPGGMLASGDSEGTIIVWDVNLKPRCRLTGHSNSIECVAFSRDRKTLVSASADGTVRFWDLTPNKEKEVSQWKSPRGSANYVAYSADENHLAIASEGGMGITELGARKDTFIASVGLVANAATKRVRFNSYASTFHGAIVTGCTDEQFAIWDATSLKAVYLSEKQKEKINDIAVNHNGYVVSAACNDGILRQWTLKRLVPRPAGPGFGQSLDLNREPLKLHEPILRKFSGHDGAVTAVAMAQKSEVTASGGVDGTVRIWGDSWGRVLRGHSGPVRSLAFGYSDGQIASASDDGTVRIWDAGAVRWQHKWSGANAPECTALSPNGDKIAASFSSGTVSLAELYTKTGRNVKSDAKSVYGLAFDPKGEVLAIAMGDLSIRLYRLGGGELAKLRGHSKGAHRLAYSLDGTRFVSASHDNSLNIWDPTSGELLRSHKSFDKPANCIALNSDGSRFCLALQDGPLGLWDSMTGDAVATLDGSKSRTTCVAFSVDGRSLATGSEDGVVRLWDAESGKEKTTLRGHAGRVVALSFSADGNRLASLDSDKAVKLWDVTCGLETITLAESSLDPSRPKATASEPTKTTQKHKLGIARVGFSKDHRKLIVVNEDGTTYIWGS